MIQQITKSYDPNLDIEFTWTLLDTPKSEAKFQFRNGWATFLDESCENLIRKNAASDWRIPNGILDFNDNLEISFDCLEGRNL